MTEIQLIHTLTHNQLKTIFAVYTSTEIRNFARYNIDGRKIEDRYVTALNYKLSNSPEFLKRSQFFDPLPYEEACTLVFSNMVIPTSARFPLKRLRERIATIVPGRCDPKLVMKLINKNVTLQNRTSYTVFAMFHRQEHRDEVQTYYKRRMVFRRPI